MGIRKKESGRKAKYGRKMESLHRLSETVLDYGICVYLILMLAVFPFYNEEGYSHIGTDKSAFFCKVGAGMGKIMAIPLALCLILRLVDFCRRRAALQKTASAETGGPSGKAGKFFRGLHRFPIKISPVDAFALLYCAALLFSYAFTEFREMALWGERGWYMGLLPQLMLVGIYALVSRFWRPRKWLLYIALPASGAVFLMGCMNRLGIYSFGLEYVGPGYISTIGNINWYCGYAVSVVFAGAVLFWLGEGIKLWQKGFLMIYTAVGYLSLILQGSDSGVITLAVVMLIMFFLSAGDAGRMCAFWQEMVLLWGGCLILFLSGRLTSTGINYKGTLAGICIRGSVCSVMTLVSVLVLILLELDRRKGKYRERLFRVLTRTTVLVSAATVLGVLLLAAVNTVHPGILGKWSGKALFTFNTAWGSSRGATWSSGWKCFAAQNILHKLVGVGPDGMWSYIDSGLNPDISASVRELFGGQRLTNAHNEWLTVLVDTGLIGLAGYAGMVVSGIRELLKKGRENPAAAACGFCLLAHTVNGIFSFQQSMGVGTAFVMFGMGKAFLRQQELPNHSGHCT